MPRVNQLLNWVMGINFLCGIVFLLAIVYEYGFRISAAEYNLIHTVYHTIWVIFWLRLRCRLSFVRKTLRLNLLRGHGFLPYCFT